MAKADILNAKRVSFLCIEVEEGQILLRCTSNVYECWTIEDGSCDILYQFGVPKRVGHDDMTMKEFVRLVMDNYFCDNIFFGSFEVR